MEIAERKVLLTGATGGIGIALTRAFAARGARLVVTGRRAEGLENLAAETGATPVVADLSDEQAVRDLAGAHADTEILLANAALPASGLLTSFTEEQIDRALDVNLRAPIVLARSLVPAMLDRGAGHLVFVSSLAGKTATGGTSVYNATKFGLRGFGSALRAELHGTGVGVSTIFPGFIRDAGMFAESGAKLPPGVGTKTSEEVATATVRAVERNHGEVDVAPIGLRLGAILGGVAPESSARLTRLLGGKEVSDRIAEGQAVKR